MKIWCRRILVILFFIGFVSLGVLWYANAVILSYNTNTFYSDFTKFADVPTSTTALIFGGGMKNAMEMSDMQYDRVLVGVDLYKLGKVQKLFLTGDDGAYRGDEISAMHTLVVSKGVPAEDILVDPHGYRTYESCYREARVYGVTSTIAISQSFHLPRIRYLCEHFGIKTIGVAADARQYDSWWVQNAREWLARLKGCLQIAITHPLPRNFEK